VFSRGEDPAAPRPDAESAYNLFGTMERAPSPPHEPDPEPDEAGSATPEPGEPSSLAERIARSIPGLTRYVRRRLGPELAAKESASDIAQSTARELLRGIRAEGSYDERGEAAFQRWIRSAAEHKIQNRARHWRAQRRAEKTESLTQGTESQAGIADSLASEARTSRDAMLHEEAERLARAFSTLPPDYRDVLQRTQVEGQSYAEVAEALGRSPEAIRKLAARALARLSGELGPPG